MPHEVIRWDRATRRKPGTERLPQDADARSRPNIILAIADDWSFPHAGAYGDRTVRTPDGGAGACVVRWQRGEDARDVAPATIYLERLRGRGIMMPECGVIKD